MTVRIAISMGDPAGIGPEIVVGALPALLAAEPDVAGVVYGPRAIFADAARTLGVALPTARVTWIEPDGGLGPGERVRPGTSDALAGRLQVASLAAALDAVLAGDADVLCTAPITKAAARAAGFAFPGHTEYLAERTGARQAVMMLAGPALRVVPLTGHIALRDVPARLEAALVTRILVATVLGLRDDFGVAAPRLALTALNPHAGEQGLMGDEEPRVLVPALEQARRELSALGLGAATLSGPHPADGLFAHWQGHDAIACCTHDQALIPLKLLHRDDGVNVTLGLPIVRTSPVHGSALDIAGRGVARPASMLAAFVMAVAIARRRTPGAGY